MTEDITDLYIRREKSRKGCMGFLVLAALVAVGVGYWLWLGRPGLPTRDTQPAAEDLDETVSVQVVEQIVTPRPAARPSATETAPPPSGADPGLALLAEARELRKADRLDDAREKAFAILDASRSAVARAEAETLLGEIHVRMVMSPWQMPEKVDYVVQSGDTLGALAKRHRTTVDLIRKGNNISGSIIRAGDRMRILNGTFSMVVDKSDNDLILSLDKRFFKRYRVGTGAYGKTPEGTFVIDDKIAQPTWWRPDGKAVAYGDPENLLGTHWLSLNIPGYGIHGTWEPDTIGKQASAGCIRLLNSDIEELFTLVPIGAEVVIKD